jgi:hypothetical protein
LSSVFTGLLFTVRRLSWPAPIDQLRALREVLVILDHVEQRVPYLGHHSAGGEDADALRFDSKIRAEFLGLRRPPGEGLHVYV